MALQEKKIMPPPWLAHREIERYSIGWRMGYGEDYIYRFGDWLDTLSPEERTEYRALFPEPVTWKGWWEDEDSGEVLVHGDFLVEAWQPEGRPKYTRQWLQQEFAAGRKRELCLFRSVIECQPFLGGFLAGGEFRTAADGLFRVVHRVPQKIGRASCRERV